MQACYDVVVIGGGPAGMAAAIAASDGGASVLLYSISAYIRDSACTTSARR